METSTCSTALIKSICELHRFASLYYLVVNGSCSMGLVNHHDVLPRRALLLQILAMMCRRRFALLQILCHHQNLSHNCLRHSHHKIACTPQSLIGSDFEPQLLPHFLRDSSCVFCYCWKVYHSPFTKKGK